MRVHHGLPAAAAGPSALTIGTFDGVHRGHVEVIRRTVALARESGLDPVVVTFDPHPRCLVDPDRCPRSLTLLDEKLALLEALGVAATVVYSFTAQVKEMPAAEFVRGLRDSLGMRRIVAGPDFALGRNREGDLAWLHADGRAHGYSVEVVPPVSTGGEELHSSDIRAAVEAGHVEDAGRMLGRSYAVRGVVEHGEKIGRRLGWPTANLGIDPRKLLPGTGVYAGHARGSFGSRMTAISAGHRPSVGGKRFVVEAHLLDFDGDLYGQMLQIELVHRLRDEEMFDSLESLARQIGVDVGQARARLEARSG